MSPYKDRNLSDNEKDKGDIMAFFPANYIKDGGIKFASADTSPSDSFSQWQTGRYDISITIPSGYRFGGVRMVTCSPYSTRWTAVVTSVTTSTISVAVTLNYGSASTLSKVTVYYWLVREDLLET